MKQGKAPDIGSSDPIDSARRDSARAYSQRPERQSGDYFEVNSWTRIRRYSI